MIYPLREIVRFRWECLSIGVTLFAISFTFAEVRSPSSTTEDGDAASATKREEFVEKNGAIFEGWKRPKLALVFSGEQNGYIEPCGCAGLENMLGGLKRRMSFIKELRDDGWPVIPLDLGGQVKRFGPQAEIKFRHAVEALATIGYPAVGFGPKDLRLEVVSVAVNFDPPEKNPFVSANVAVFGFDSGFTRRFRVIESGGFRVGVTSVLGKSHQKDVGDSDTITIYDPAESLAEVAPLLQAENCDFLVLLSHATPDESKQLAKRFPMFQFVATAGGAEVPPKEAELIAGTNTRLIEVGAKGMYVTVVGIFDDSNEPVRYQRVPLDARFPDAPRMQATMIAYQEELETLGLNEVGAKAIPFANGKRFAGTQSCVGCHVDAAEVFEETPHSHATATLIDISDPPRQHDPECLSCHVTGWNPQKYFPYESGFVSMQETPEMRANGCENCHGPGAAHVAAEAPDANTPPEELERLRAELRLKIVDNEGNKPGQDGNGKVVRMCIECHDIDNSPDFDFQEYWPEVEHYGLE